MPAVAELSRQGVALSHELGLGVGHPLMRVVRALFACEVDDHPGAIVVVVGSCGVRLFEAFERGPSIDPRAAHGGVVQGQRLLLPAQIDDCVDEASGNIRCHQALEQAVEMRLV